METEFWRAGNPARSRLSAGSGCMSTRPRKLLSSGSQPCLYRILLNISPNAVELLTRADQTIEALLLPKWAMGTEEKICLMSSESLQWTQPFARKHVRSCQKMDMIRHHDVSMQLITVQFVLSVFERRHHHLCNFRSPQKQRASGACVQQPIDGHERLPCGKESDRRGHPTGGKTAVQSERDKQRIPGHIPMGQSPFIMPHTPSWCGESGGILRGLQPPFRQPGRLKAGCGHDCPPSI